ncbi:hypothetical protein LJC49_07105 [Ruminococcaceae bacterium OttesenSCG-928-I18]|nr:hypothetical protein [Ruminococcaceae bacterium OttesenSCG-928-I18]
MAATNHTEHGFPLPEATDTLARQDILDISNNVEGKFMSVSTYDPPEQGQTTGPAALAGGIKPLVDQQTQGLKTISADETDTGKTWIDGRKIYRKVVHVPTLGAANAWVTTPHGISGSIMPISVFGIYKNKGSTTVGIAIPDYRTTVGVNGAELTMLRTVDSTSLEAYVILEYVKMA